MRKTSFLATLLFLFLCTALSMAQSVRSGSLQVSCGEKEMIQVEVDGPMYFRESVSGDIIFSGLLPGNYRLKISLNSGRGRVNVLVDEKIRITSGERLSFYRQRNGRFSVRNEIDRNSILLCPEYNPGPGRTPVPRRGPELINDRDFNNLILGMKKASFDDNKLDLLKASLGYNLFHTGQMMQIMKLFSFDDNRLECARLLVPWAYDPVNLYQLGDAFSFISTKDKYYQFLKTNR